MPKPWSWRSQLPPASAARSLQKAHPQQDGAWEWQQCQMMRQNLWAFCGASVQNPEGRWSHANLGMSVIKAFEVLCTSQHILLSFSKDSFCSYRHNQAPWYLLTQNYSNIYFSHETIICTGIGRGWPSWLHMTSVGAGGQQSKHPPLGCGLSRRWSEGSWTFNMAAQGSKATHTESWERDR